MTEQTANIKAIIPQLQQQMAMSQDMQKAIFQEMIQLIPTFFESFKKAIPSDLTETSLASPPPAITEIRYYNDRDPEGYREQSIEDLKKLIEEQFLEQRGTKESLAEKLAPPPPPAIIDPAVAAEKLRQSIPSKKVLSASTDPVYLAWITKLGGLKSQYNALRRKIRAEHELQRGFKNRSAGQQNTIIANTMKNSNARRDITNLIRQMSNDYRNPNNHIRENALRLRREMPQWS